MYSTKLFFIFNAQCVLSSLVDNALKCTIERVSICHFTIPRSSHPFRWVFHCTGTPFFPGNAHSLIPLTLFNLPTNILKLMVWMRGEPRLYLFQCAKDMCSEYRVMLKIPPYPAESAASPRLQEKILNITGREDVTTFRDRVRRRRTTCAKTTGRNHISRYGGKERKSCSSTQEIDGREAEKHNSKTKETERFLSQCQCKTAGCFLRRQV